MVRLSYIQIAEKNYKNGKNPNVKKIVKYFLDMNIADTTKSAYLSKYKGTLKKIRDDPILEKLKLSSELSEKVWNSKQKSLNDKENIVIKKQSIEKKLMGLENSNNYYKLAIFLLLQCGRRLNEFLNLEVIKGNNDNSLLFKGQSKSKTVKEYNIPLLNI